MGNASNVGDRVAYRTRSNPCQPQSATASTRAIPSIFPLPGRTFPAAFSSKTTPSSAYHAVSPVATIDHPPQHHFRPRASKGYSGSAQAIPGQRSPPAPVRLPLTAMALIAACAFPYFCVLRSAFSILHSPFSILHSPFSILHSAFSMFHRRSLDRNLFTPHIGSTSGA